MKPPAWLVAAVAAILAIGGGTVAAILDWPTNAGIARPAVEVQIAVLDPAEAYQPGTARV